jgi:hypothetical protein
VVQKELKKANLKLILWEYGFNGGLEAFFSKVGFWRVKSHPNDLQPSLEDLKKRISETPLGKSQCLLGVSLIPLESTRHLAIVLNLNHNISSEERIFGDLESPIFSWVANIVMDFLRKNLKKENK